MTPEVLAAFLADSAHAGVYRLTAGLDTGPDAEACSTRLCWHDLAPRPELNRETLLAALAEALRFPDYFGHNWDAAWDCLTELEWRPGKPRVIRLTIGEGGRVDEAALEDFLELMDEACRYWARRGRVLCVLIAAPATGSVVLERLAPLP